MLHHVYVLPVGSEVGVNLDQFASASASTVNILKPDGEELGMVVFSGLKPNGAKIYVKDGDNGVCYEGVADSSNGGGETWTVTMSARELPGDCQPTPTPEQPTPTPVQVDCCGDMVKIPTNGSMATIDGGTISTFESGVEFCLSQLTEIVEDLSVTILDPTGGSQFGGSITLSVRPVDTKIRYVSPNTEKCYEGDLSANTNGMLILQEV